MVDIYPCVVEGDPGLDGGHPDDFCVGDVAFVGLCLVIVPVGNELGERGFCQRYYGLWHLAIKLPLDGDGAAGGAAGEGAPRGDSDQRQHGDSDTGLPAGALGDAGDPLPEGPGAAGHGGGGGEAVGGFPTGQAEQGAGVGPPLPFAQGADGGLVAGALPVPAGEDSPPPHQGVVPVQRHAHPPQKGPDGVPVAEVGGLMGHGVAQGLWVLQNLWGQVDGRTGQAEETGGLHGLGDVDGAAGPRHLHRLAGPPELPGKAEVGPGQPQGDRCHPHQPEQGEPLVQGEGGQPLSFLSRGDGDGGGRRWVGGLRGGGRCWVGGLNAGDGDTLCGRIRRDRGAGGQGGDGVAHGEGGPPEVHGDQQPHQHQGPQGVLEAGIDPAAQGVAQADYGGGQDAGAKDPFHHDVLPPFLAAWRTRRQSPPGAGLAFSSGH